MWLAPVYRLPLSSILGMRCNKTIFHSAGLRRERTRLVYVDRFSPRRWLVREPSSSRECKSVLAFQGRCLPWRRRSAIRKTMSSMPLPLIDVYFLGYLLWDAARDDEHMPRIRGQEFRSAAWASWPVANLNAPLSPDYRRPGRLGPRRYWPWPWR